MSGIYYLDSEGEMLPVIAHTEMLAQQFLATYYQSHRAYRQTTSITIFRPKKLTLNDTYSDCVKQPTNNTKQINCKQYKTRVKAFTDIRSKLIWTKRATN